MGFVFISHASEDKPRIRSLVKALAFEGIQLWLDRPGYGGSHFNFDQEFILRHNIRALQSGKLWPEQLSDALNEASAVLLCISRSLCKERTVLSQEVAIGIQLGKLTACIVDDLAEVDLPTELGLVDLSKIQTERIDSKLLDIAVAAVEAGQIPAALAPELKAQWERVLKLKADIRRIFFEHDVDSLSSIEVHHACNELAQYPIGPAVQCFDIPAELIELFADRFDRAARSRRVVSLAMSLTHQCNVEGFSERQILLMPGEVVPPETTSPLQYWTDVFCAAGMKSRRTLASLLISPLAPRKALSEPASKIYEDFLKRLASGSAG